MPAFRFFLVLIALTLLLSGRLVAADKSERELAEARLLASLKYLSSDELEGRGLGTEGLNKAAEFIAQQFADMGLKTDIVDGGPFQPFEVATNAVMGPPKNNTLVLTGPPKDGQPQVLKLTLGEQFNPLALGGKGSVADAPLVLAGYGITADDPQYDDYQDLDVKGKVVVIIRKEPQQADADSPFNGRQPSSHAPFVRKISNALEHGAAGVILVNDGPEVGRGKQNAERRWRAVMDQLSKLEADFRKLENPAPKAAAEHRGKVLELATELKQLNTQLAGDGDRILGFLEAGGQSQRSSNTPVFFALRSTINQAVEAATGRSLDQVEAAIDKELKPQSSLLEGWTVSAQADLDSRRLKVKNVIGVLEGKGPLANETVVVGAHYDHVGQGGRGSGSLAPWTVAVHNGADDNASGTSTMMEIARHFASQSGRPRRRLVFMAFSAEERGLLGSAHYVRNPLFALEKTVAMVNLDMVGRLTDNRLIVAGTGTAKTFDELLEQLNKKHGFGLTKQTGGLGPSDHASFYQKKIPVLHFFTGTHPDYHRPSDDYDKVNIEGMRRISEMVSEVVERIADQEAAPEYVAIRRRERPLRAGNPVPFLGAQANRQEQDGFHVAQVAPKSPASQAGLKTGDVILQIGETKIARSPDAEKALKQFKPGDKVVIRVRREDEELDLEATLGPPR